MKAKLLFWIFPCLVGFAVSPALGNLACSDTPSAIVSHFVTLDNEYRGYVNAHVSGQPPPVGLNQATKTLFFSEVKYEEAWTQLGQERFPLLCHPSTAAASEAARTITQPLVSLNFSEADGNGRCTVQRQVNTQTIIFVSRKSEATLDTPSGWILYSAYPRS